MRQKSLKGSITNRYNEYLVACEYYWYKWLFYLFGIWTNISSRRYFLFCFQEGHLDNNMMITTRLPFYSCYHRYVLMKMLLYWKYFFLLLLLSRTGYFINSMEVTMEKWLITTLEECCSYCLLLCFYFGSCSKQVTRNSSEMLGYLDT